MGNPTMAGIFRTWPQGNTYIEGNAMRFIETALEGVYIVEPKVLGDNRGFFMESWSERDFESAGLHYDFVQDNCGASSSSEGTRPRQSWCGACGAQCWMWR